MDLITTGVMVKDKSTGKVVECKVFLDSISGGKRIIYVSDDGSVVKSEQLNKSKYKYQAAPEKYIK